MRDASPLTLAELCHIELGLDSAGRRTLARWAGEWWRSADGHHRPFEAEALRASVWTVLRRVDVEGVDDDGNVERKQLAVRGRLVSEVLDAMIAVGDRLDTRAQLPCELSGYDGPRVRHLAIVRNGLLDLDSGTLYPSTPRLFATAGAAVDYDPDATCPAWERFLESIFADEDAGDDGIDRETIRLVRQIFGWALAVDVTRHAIPIFVGPTRSGKSTTMAILRALLGEGNTCAPPLASLAESRFGLAPLIGKTAAIIPDARLGTRADQATVAGLLLAASGRDAIEIDRKNRDSIEVRLRCQILIVSNELPRIGDASGALAARFRIVETRRSFLGCEDRELEPRLRAELPGILRWALDGWRDLEANGWASPPRARELLEELDRLGSPIKAFVSDRLELRAGAETSPEVLFEAWRRWCEGAGRKETGTLQSFARDLRAAVPEVRVVARRRDAGPRQRMYVGLGLQGDV